MTTLQPSNYGTVNALACTTGQLSAPAAPTTSTATTGGSLAAATYTIAITWVSAYGETTIGTTTTQTTTGTTSTITVTIPTAPVGAVYYKVYANSSASPLFLQTVTGSLTQTPVGTTSTTFTSLSSTTQPPSTNTSQLPGDTNLLAGRQSAIADNTADLADDALLGGTIVTSGTITAGTIEIWSFAMVDGTNFTAGASASGDGSLSLATGGLKHLMQDLETITVDTTGRTYAIGPFSIANAWGGSMPEKWGFFVVHNLGSGVITTTMKYVPLKYTNV
jgi:hypothetical protein